MRSRKPSGFHRGQDGDGVEREVESPRVTTEAKMEMGLNEKQKTSILPQRPKRRKMRG